MRVVSIFLSNFQQESLLVYFPLTRQKQDLVNDADICLWLREKKFSLEEKSQNESCGAF